MADYWPYSDRMAPGLIHTKRPRADYDELPLPGAASYGHGELRYDERDARMPWRDPEPLDFSIDYNRSGAAYASGGMTSTNILGLSDGPLMGTSVPGTVRVSSMGMSGLDDPSMIGQGGRLLGVDNSMMKGASLGLNANLGLNGGIPEYLPRQDSQGARSAAPGLLPPDATPTLFVEGLPSDCSRREAAHVFRPFLGFKEVRLVHKESRRPGGDTFILCFVDFTDSRCAAIALEALQGYKFDETNRDAEPLRLQFARMPGPRGGGRDRDDFPRGHPPRR